MINEFFILSILCAFVAPIWLVLKSKHIKLGIVFPALMATSNALQALVFSLVDAPSVAILAAVAQLVLWAILLYSESAD